jgi:predicted GNAT family N-acyltransferase
MNTRDKIRKELFDHEQKTKYFDPHGRSPANQTHHCRSQEQCGSGWQTNPLSPERRHPTVRIGEKPRL